MFLRNVSGEGPLLLLHRFHLQTRLQYEQFSLLSLLPRVVDLKPVPPTMFLRIHTTSQAKARCSCSTASTSKHASSTSSSTSHHSPTRRQAETCAANNVLTDSLQRLRRSVAPAAPLPPPVGIIQPPVTPHVRRRAETCATNNALTDSLQRRRRRSVAPAAPLPPNTPPGGTIQPPLTPPKGCQAETCAANTIITVSQK